MTTPTLPFWVLQRQVKAEPVGEDTLRLTAPNLPVHEIQLQQPDGTPGWKTVVYRLPTGEGEKTLVAESTHPFDDRQTAWDVGLELFREYVIV